MTKRLEQADDRTEELLPDLVSGFTSAIERSEWDRARDDELLRLRAERDLRTQGQVRKLRRARQLLSEVLGE